MITFIESGSFGYKNRTIVNASSDVTIAFACDFSTSGEKLTKKSVLEQGKKYLAIDANNLNVTEFRVNKIVDILNKVNAKTLNIAGNGIYTLKGKYYQYELDEFVYNLLLEVISSDNLKNKCITIRSGGQTGFDESGAKAGDKLGLETIILAPRGWKFRTQYGTDISDEEKFKERFN